MRILIATDVFPPRCGGSGWSTYHLARVLRARGHAITIVRARTDGGSAEPYEYDGFRVEQIAQVVPPLPVARNVAKNEFFWLRAAGVLASVARCAQSDVIHGQHVMTIPAAVRAGRLVHRPVVATVRDYWPTCPISTRLRPEGVCDHCSIPRLTQCLAGHQPERYPVVALFQPYIRANRARRQAALRGADRVIAVSNYVADDLRRHAGVAAEVIPNLVDVPDELPARPDGWSGERPYAIFVGKLDHHKGADLVPELVAAAARELELVMIGDGRLRATIEQDCRARGLPLRLFPNLPNDQVLRWLAHARALVFPARWPEPLSRVLLEAASVGCPIIASPTGGTPDTLIDWVSGYLADRPGDFPLRLRQLVDDEHVYQLVRRAARNVARQRFAAPVVAARVEALYASLVPS